MHIQTHIHTHTHTYIHTYIHIHRYFDSDNAGYIEMPELVQVIHTYTTHAHTNAHTYTHTHTHTYIHTYIHIHRYFDSDNAGYIEMPEFVQVMESESGSRKSQRPFPHEHKPDMVELNRLLKFEAHPRDPPENEWHPLARECIRTGSVNPKLVNMVREFITAKAAPLRQTFRYVDISIY
jgi:hypothetical protein